MGPLKVSEGVGGLWFQIFVVTSDLTQIDTRQKDLQLSDAWNHPNQWPENLLFQGFLEVRKGTPLWKLGILDQLLFFLEKRWIFLE